MKKLNNVDARKFYEYKEILEVLRETLSENDPVEIRLNNPTLRTLAGYTEESNEQNFNPLVKNFMDKLAFDVQKEKASQDKNAVNGITEEMLEMAGYVKDNEMAVSGRVNEYAKSFVDRSLMQGKLDRLFLAIQHQDSDTIDRVYRDIYKMTSYSEEKPFGVVNEYAQSFVDSRINEFVKKGIHIQKVEQR